MTFEEFCEFYEEKDFLPNDVGKRKSSLNTNQLRTRYNKYRQQEDKKRERFDRLTAPDDKWNDLKENIDLTGCTLINKLRHNSLFVVIDSLFKNAGPWVSIIDPAHIFSKGAYPHMKYELRNVVSLNRYSHTCLDENRSPIDGEFISQEEKEAWWSLIVGEERYAELVELSKRR